MPMITDSTGVFIDTSVLVSLEDKNDSNHKKAIVISKLLFEQKIQLYTSSDVIVETLTVVSRKLGKKAAIKFYKQYLESEFIELFIDKDLHEETRKFFLQTESKNISFIDCSSVMVMKKTKIRTIFTFDEDFKKLGVDLLNH